MSDRSIIILGNGTLKIGFIKRVSDTKILTWGVCLCDKYCFTEVFGFENLEKL